MRKERKLLSQEVRPEIKGEDQEVREEGVVREAEEKKSVARRWVMEGCVQDLKRVLWVWRSWRRVDSRLQLDE